MSQTKYTMTGIVLVVLLLGLSTATATDTVTRTLPETAFPDDTITVSLTIDFDDQTAVDRLVITETVPAGWEIVDASNGGILAAPGKVSWIMIEVLGGTIPPDGAVFTYHVTVPPDASGTCPFSGIYGTNTAGTNLDVSGDADITVSTGGDTTPPTVTTNTPTGTGVPVSTVITVTFSKAMNQTSAEGAFSIAPPVAGSFSWSGDMMVFTPDVDLECNTTHHVTIGTGAMDLAGNSLEAPFNWEFATAPPPTVTANTPTGAGVSVSTAITVTFSKAMNQASAEGAFAMDPSVTGSFSWYGDMMVFTPDANLECNTTHHLTIGTGAMDLAGNPLEDPFIWEFTTAPEPDTTPPTVTTNTPTGTGVSVSTVITVTFSKAMNQASAEGAFSIVPPVTGSFSWSGDMMVFTPDADLEYTRTHNVTIG
ncbi:MAG: Ig-like domain-containing protein, partial [Euryarchaeota archaeon]|nr:Ig-like domain-containing protein [Euryarchaeota archaeon]